MATAESVPGYDFGPGGSTTVTIDNSACSIDVHNHTHIICTTPTGQGVDLAINLLVTPRAFACLLKRAAQVSAQAPLPHVHTYDYIAPSVTSVEPSNTSTLGGTLTLR